MRFMRRQYRSAGILVPATCYRAIRAADRARSSERWANAAILYREALTECPELVHIRIQLGHALKESGDSDGAEQAYQKARKISPSDRDASLHLGHLLKVARRFDEAAECYVSLALRDPGDDEAMREACDVIRYLEEPERRTLAEQLIRNTSWWRWQQDPAEGAGSECAIVYDASDLLSYFNHARRPTGIQRVQIETIVAGLLKMRAGGPRVGVCCFIAGRDEWVTLPTDAFLSLAALSVSNGTSDDHEWRQSRDELQLWLLVAPAFDFAQNAALVNLGTSWWLQNYFLHVRDVQQRRGITYIPLIYDMIPVLFPDFCIDDLVRDFISWLNGVFKHTQKFLAISESSKRDLITIAARQGYAIEDTDVLVIPLDADFGTVSAVDDAVTLPTGLGQEPFVLLVSTIEPRKGHLVALEAWSLLISRIGASAVPRLVFVGRKGWRNDAVYERLFGDPRLQSKITFLADLSDGELGELYSRSLFTIYPSLYEGWGLPVTEALCRGKVVITTTSSSLPEAGRDLAIYVPPNDAAALADAVRPLIIDPALIAKRESIIVANFTPRSWDSVAAQIGSAVGKLAALAESQPGPATYPPVANAATNYWLARSFALRLRGPAAQGEEFRTGLGWQAPDEDGCRLKPGGAALSFRAPGDINPGTRATITVRLIGKHQARSGFEVSCGDHHVADTLARKERLDVAIDVTIPPDLIVNVAISEKVEETDVENALVTTGTCDPIGVECLSVIYAPLKRCSVAKPAL